MIPRYLPTTNPAPHPIPSAAPSTPSGSLSHGARASVAEEKGSPINILIIAISAQTTDAIYHHNHQHTTLTSPTTTMTVIVWREFIYCFSAKRGGVQNVMLGSHYKLFAELSSLRQRRSSD
ncbi:hypothetical protein ZHAS_00008507 [Anopheles sinensis]|uniref:Uncharacterized protein n=1 Tax=Anopheles sinensis TaxID=74873 RepID=A0A084VSL6_ANOSI|nr:hypothetical protein ZHAS_00008507 [Anopheles sinensis]